MKNKIELIIATMIKYVFIIGAIVLPLFGLVLKYAYGVDVNMIALILFPILCIPFIKIFSFQIRRIKKEMEKE